MSLIKQKLDQAFLLLQIQKKFFILRYPGFGSYAPHLLRV